MIVGTVRATQLEWREPEDEQVVERQPAPSPAPAPESPSAPPSTAQERPGAPLPRTLLDTLPPAPFQPPRRLLPTPPTAPGPAVPIAAPPAVSAGYVGERPVDPAWLAARETTLVDVRADYEAARAKAQANGGTGPGWAAVFVTDESGQVSQQLEFNEEAFAASYRAQGGAPLQALAAQYGTDAATLLAQHPDLWNVATHDHALNAGPGLAGVAMGNASQLGMLDLYLADPQIASLIAAYGGTAAPATGGIAPEQVRIYGQARYDQLTRLGNAMASVRTQYSTALAEGLRNGTGPGWVESTSPTYATDESGQQIGGPTGTITVRSFDPDAFTAWYNKQDGLQNKAFADFYGASHTQYVSDESGHSAPGTITFDNPNWSMSEVSGTGSYRMTHRELVGIDPNSPPDLNDDQAVGFDLQAGWATSQSNIHQDTDWFEIAFKVVIVAAVSYFSAGTLGPEVAGAMGMTATAGTAGSVTLASGLTLSATGAVVSAAVAGAVTSVVSGMVNDNLSFKSILQGALAGALTAGLTGPSTDLGKAASSVGPVGTIALNTTVQGGIQALLGGSFKDGAIAGFASGLANLAGASIGKGIDDAVNAGTMSVADAFAARTLARVFTSAVKALGNPNDPNYGFASALVNDVVGQAMEPAPAAGATPPATTPAAPVPAAPAAEAPPADEVAPPAAAPAPAPAVPVPEPAPAPAAEAPPADEPAPVAPSPTLPVQTPGEADAASAAARNQQAIDALAAAAQQYGGYDKIPSDAPELKLALASVQANTEALRAQLADGDTAPGFSDPVEVADNGAAWVDAATAAGRQGARNLFISGGVVAGMFESIGKGVIGAGVLVNDLLLAQKFIAYGGDTAAHRWLSGDAFEAQQQAYKNVLALNDAIVQIAKDPTRYLGDAVGRSVEKVTSSLTQAQQSDDLNDWLFYGRAVGNMTMDVASVVGGAAGAARLATVGAGELNVLLRARIAELGPDVRGNPFLAEQSPSTGSPVRVPVQRSQIAYENATVADSTGVPWGKGIEAQGMAWEDYLATKVPAETRLPPKFETFDFFDRETGVATSAKTLDTTTPAKVANPSQVYSSLKGNIDVAANFERAELLDVEVLAGDISKRVIEVAVSEGTTAAQWDQIAKAIEYGKSRGVVVKITRIKS